MDLIVTLNLWQLLGLVLALLIIGLILGAKLREWAEKVAEAILLYRASPPPRIRSIPTRFVPHLW